MGYLRKMPTQGKKWIHATFSVCNSWLPGDPRGFRSRDHKIHSSGDHRNPPPKGEHAGLHEHAKSISGKPTVLNMHQREVAGNAVRKNLDKHGHRTLVIAVGGLHVHLLTELPADDQAAKDAIGFAKLSASMQLNDTLPGRVWAKGSNRKPIRGEAHHRRTFKYIRDHRDEGAWVWTFRDGPIEKM